MIEPEVMKPLGHHALLEVGRHAKSKRGGTHEAYGCRLCDKPFGYIDVFSAKCMDAGEEARHANPEAE